MNVEAKNTFLFMQMGWQSIQPCCTQYPNSYLCKYKNTKLKNYLTKVTYEFYLITSLKVSDIKTFTFLVICKQSAVHTTVLCASMHCINCVSHIFLVQYTIKSTIKYNEEV